MTRKSNSQTETIAPIVKPTARKTTKHHKKAAGPAVAPVEPRISYEEVARLAYSYWEARGCQGGTPESDWLRAEQELRSAV